MTDQPNTMPIATRQTKSQAARPAGWRRAVLLLLLLALVSAAQSCRQGKRGAEKLAEDSAAAQESQSNLTFQNITLEQPDEKGKTLWKVKAEQATYSPDKQVAQVKNPNGQLFQDGKAIYQIQAAQGEVRQDGNRIMLRGNVLVTDLKSGATLRGNELEWQPKQDLLTIRGNLRGSHPKVDMTADEARVSNRQRRTELLGQQVVAISKDPKLQMQGTHIIWMMDQQQLLSDRPVQVQRYEGNQPTDRASGDQAEVNMAAKTVQLKQNGRLSLVDPPVEVASNLLDWSLQDQTVVSNQPITVFHRQEQVMATAETGRMTIKDRMFYLNRNAHAVSQRNQSNLTSDNMTWNIPTQQFDAEGNVHYTQVDPYMDLRGPKAVGQLANKTIVVSGGRVVTEIIPNSKN